MHSQSHCGLEMSKATSVAVGLAAAVSLAGDETGSSGSVPINPSSFSRSLHRRGWGGDRESAEPTLRFGGGGCEGIRCECLTSCTQLRGQTNERKVQNSDRERRK